MASQVSSTFELLLPVFASLSWCGTQDSCDPTLQGTRSSSRRCPGMEMSDRRGLQRKARATGILLNHCLVTARSCNECTARGRKRCSDYLCGPTKKPDLVCVPSCLRCYHSKLSHTIHTQTPTQPRPSRPIHVSPLAHRN